MSKLLLFAGALVWSSLSWSADPPSTHGMFLFGKKTHYVSHLPMFHFPHDYQLIMEINFESLPRTTTLLTYQNFKRSGKEFFTLVPERMDLSQVIEGKKKEFFANIFEGHFERQGRALGPVKAKVTKVIFSKKLKPLDPQTNQFIAFGKDGEYYAAHNIGGHPSFDWIGSISGIAKITRFPFVERCQRRHCGESRVSTQKPIQSFVTDDQYPIVISPIQPIGPNEQPNKRTVFYGAKGTSKVLKTLYYEKDELSH